MVIDKSNASEIHGVQGVRFFADEKYYNAQWEEVVRMEGEVWITKSKAIEIAKEKEQERAKSRIIEEPEHIAEKRRDLKLTHDFDALGGDLAYLIASIDITFSELKTFKHKLEAAFDSISRLK